MLAVYKPGDYVFCSFGGVWLVEGAGDETLNLKEHGSGNRKHVSGHDNDIVRAVSSKEKVLDVIDRIGFIRTIRAPNDKIRREFYEEAMSKYDEFEWVKVIKSVYMRKQDGRLMRGEAEYAEKAKSYFHGEVSVVLGIPVDEVEEYISAAVSCDGW
jgi:CarD family transcriptional regulator